MKSIRRSTVLTFTGKSTISLKAICLLSIVIAMAVPSVAGADIVISEIEAFFSRDNPRRARFAILNTGMEEVDISNYSLFTPNQGNGLAGTEQIFGDLSLSPGERYVGTSFNFSGVDSRGQLSLYSSLFRSDSTFVDYVQWGSVGFVDFFSESSRAVRVGQWTRTSDTVTTIPGPEQSLVFDGDGNSPGDWSVQATSLTAAVVPEPSSFAITLLGFLGLASRRRRSA